MTVASSSGLSKHNVVVDHGAPWQALLDRLGRPHSVSPAGGSASIAAVTAGGKWFR
jgi:hypothetical protein